MFVSSFNKYCRSTNCSAMPVQELTVHIARDISDDVISNDVEAPIRNNIFVTCTASGYPPPRLYWYENSNLVTDSSRYLLFVLLPGIYIFSLCYFKVFSILYYFKVFIICTKCCLIICTTTSYNIFLNRNI